MAPKANKKAPNDDPFTEEKKILEECRNKSIASQTQLIDSIKNLHEVDKLKYRMNAIQSKIIGENGDEDNELVNKIEEQRKFSDNTKIVATEIIQPLAESIRMAETEVIKTLAKEHLYTKQDYLEHLVKRDQLYTKLKPLIHAKDSEFEIDEKNNMHIAVQAKTLNQFLDLFLDYSKLSFHTKGEIIKMKSAFAGMCTIFTMSCKLNNKLAEIVKNYLEALVETNTENGTQEKAAKASNQTSIFSKIKPRVSKLYLSDSQGHEKFDEWMVRLIRLRNTGEDMLIEMAETPKEDMTRKMIGAIQKMKSTSFDHFSDEFLSLIHLLNSLPMKSSKDFKIVKERVEVFKKILPDKMSSCGCMVAEECTLEELLLFEDEGKRVLRIDVKSDKDLIEVFNQAKSKSTPVANQAAPTKDKFNDLLAQRAVQFLLKNKDKAISCVSKDSDCRKRASAIKNDPKKFINKLLKKITSEKAIELILMQLQDSKLLNKLAQFANKIDSGQNFRDGKDLVKAVIYGTTSSQKDIIFHVMKLVKNIPQAFQENFSKILGTALSSVGLNKMDISGKNPPSKTSSGANPSQAALKKVAKLFVEGLRDFQFRN